MLEIFALIYLTKKNGNIAKEKGHSKGSYIFLTIALWFGGEIIGAIIGVMITEGMGAYIFAFIGAIMGAIISYQIVKNLSDKNYRRTLA